MLRNVFKMTSVENLNKRNSRMCNGLIKYSFLLTTKMEVL